MKLPLGPSCMKKRHLTALGYEVISLPYWKYRTNMTTQQKKNVLLDAAKNR